MMDIAGFALAVLLVELTPGPNMGWLVALTLAEGRRAGLAAISGIALGLAGNAALSVLAASFILSQSAGLAQIMSGLAAAMMAWLAWQAWRTSGNSSAVATPTAAARPNFYAGLVINLLNPKAALFFITVMPQFIAGGQPSLPQGLMMAAISLSIATGIHLALVLGAEQMRPMLMAHNRAMIVRRVLAVGMLGVAVWFLAKAFG
jgi:threonine/homoserine/homoserine lactone efflux protein